MMKRDVRAVFAVLLSLVCARAFATEEGKSLYMNSCSMCHGNTMDGRGPVGKNLTPHLKHLKTYSVAQIVQVLETAKTVDGGQAIPMMTEFQTSLSAVQKKAVAEYVFQQTQKK